MGCASIATRGWGGTRAQWRTAFSSIVRGGGKDRVAVVIAVICLGEDEDA